MSRKTKLSVILAVIVLLVAVRVALPHLLLPGINQQLAAVSEVVEVHVGGLGLSLFRGAYHFDDVTLRSKVDQNRQEVVRIDSLDVSLAWRELFKGHIFADAHIEGMTLTLGVDLSRLNQRTTREEKKENAKNIVHQMIPFDVSRVTVVNSRILYYSAREKEKFELINAIEGRISNITNGRKENKPIPSLVSVKGNLFGGASVTITGELLPFRKPLAMSFRIKAEKFNLPQANRFLIGVVPLSFSAGSLNLFSEFRYEDNSLKGYAKPFFHDVKVIPRKEGFVGAKHFFIEVSTALANLIFRNGETKTTAAVIEFEKPKDREFSAKIAKIFSTAFHNGYVNSLPEDFEKDHYQLKNN